MARWTEEQVEHAVGSLLRIGVLLAAAVAAVGGGAYLIHHGTAVVDYRAFSGEPHELRAVGGIVGSALSLHSLGVIQLGLVLLIATPIARVALTLIAFWQSRDRRYVVITGIVLAILVFSLSGSRL